MRQSFDTHHILVSVILLVLIFGFIRPQWLEAQSTSIQPSNMTSGEFPQKSDILTKIDSHIEPTSSYVFGGVPDDADWPIQNRVAISRSSEDMRLMGFGYPDFTSLAGLSLAGVAVQSGDRLRLTPSAMYETGAVWHTSRQFIRDGFETTFQFQITELVNEGADGFAFVIQNHSGLAIGSGGGSLGYAFIPDSLAIEFDTSQNNVISDPSSNHISIQTRGREVNDANHAYSMGSTNSIPNLSDGNVHTATVTYTPDELQIFLDGTTPILTVSVNLSETLGLDDGYAWAGFTATTGALWENHDILSWSFRPGVSETLVSADDIVTPMIDQIHSDSEHTYRMLVNNSRPTPPVVDSQSPQYHPASGRYHNWNSALDSSCVAPPSPDSSDHGSARPAAQQSWPGVFALDQIASPDTTFVITSTTDAGPGSLREAMNTANAGDTIIFDPAIFSPAAPATIALESPLPDMTQGNLTIDASNAGVVLDGGNLSQGNGLRITSDSNVIKGLKIIHFPYNGIEITNGAQHNQIGGNWTVGEGPQGEGNIITLNGNDGIDIHGTGTMSNTVSGNLIGLDEDGTRDFRVQEIAISPVYTEDHTVFIGTRYNGAWKTTDGGETWIAVNNGLTISNVLALDISPAYGSDQTLFIGSQEGTVFKTTDGGMSWARVDGGMVGDRRIQALDISPNYANDGEVFVVEDDKGLFVSTDRGITWENRSSGLSGHEWELDGLRLSPDYAIDQTVFAFYWDKIFKSTDKGHSWTIVTDEIHNLGALAFSPDYATDQTVFVGVDHCEAETRSIFWKSTDGGTHWTPISGTVGTCGVRVMQVAPDYATSQTVFAGDAWGGVYKSTDEGASWLRVKSGRFSWALAISPGYAQDQTVFVGQNTGKILRSVDAGNIWIRLGADLTEQGNYDEGIHIWDGAQWNLVGGETNGEKNVISNNGMRGVVIQNNDTADNQIVGNYIGTDANGISPLGNDTEGIVVERGARFNLLHGNVIAGNAMTGIQIRYAEAMSNTITGNHIGVDVSGTKPLGNNGEGVTLMHGAQGNQVGGAIPMERNVIGSNAGSGVTLWHPETKHNIVSGNYIGVDASGDLPLGNYHSGVDFGSISTTSGPQENRVGGTSPGERNMISANGAHGIIIGRSTHNVIVGNYIGVDATGTVALGNRYTGIGIYAGAQHNHIGGSTSAERNIISGNSWCGIGLWDANVTRNTVVGNYIGTNVSGTVALGNVDSGVIMWGGTYNHIGGSTTAERNIISGNGDDGITLSGANAVSNTISGNYIGLDATGTMIMGNANNGIDIYSGAQFNRIGGATSGERNVISGNDDHGVSIWGENAKYNILIGNYIGTDAGGTTALGNAIDGVFLGSGTQHNEIGGHGTGEGNVISGNGGDGVGLWNNNTNHNLVLGNYIGIDSSGMKAVGNANVGVAIGDNAQSNRIGGSMSSERNTISGNGGHGIGLWDSGTMSNTIVGNYIGTNVVGTEALGNIGGGVIFANGAQYNQLGGSTSSERNVISGNKEHGVGIWDVNTVHNVVSGNYIGLDATGFQSIGNSAAGIGIGNGAQYNRIGGTTPDERNVIAGSHWDGVHIWGSGTSSNTVIGNYIGTDASGTNSLRNYGAGLGLRDGAQRNHVGGIAPEESNLISGNEDAGVTLSGPNTMSNTVIGNQIGVIDDGTRTLGNRYGIFCLWNARFNTIENNVIGGSVYDGIHIDNCDANTMIGNYIGTDANGVLDLGNGENGVSLFNNAQENIIGPGNVIAYNEKRGISVWDTNTLYNTVIRNAIYNNFTLGIVNGNSGNAYLSPPTLTHVTTQSVSGFASKQVLTIELYSDRDKQGRIYEGRTVPDVTGAFVFNQSFPLYGTHLTAIAIDANGNTSEFSEAATIAKPDCLSRSHYEALKAQALDAYPDDSQLRIGALITALNQEWEDSNGAIGFEWSASVFEPRTQNFGYHSVVWTDTGYHNPEPDLVGTWTPESNFHLEAWGIFKANGWLQMFSSGRSARLCSDANPEPPATVSVSGAASGTVGTNYGFTAVVSPVTTTTPITYHWQSTEQSPQAHVDDQDSHAAFYWRIAGQKSITVTAQNAGGSAVSNRVVDILETEPFTSTGYAVTVPITFPDLSVWQACTFTTAIPSGTSMSVSVLDTILNPLPGWNHIPLNDGLTTLDLRSIDSSKYPILRLRVDLSSTVPTLSPKLKEWQLTGAISEPGDAYEDDDTCAQATSISTDGTVQHHTFHDVGDIDWTDFEANTDTTYVMQATSTGPEANLILELHDICNHAIITDTSTLVLFHVTSLDFLMPIRVRYGDYDYQNSLDNCRRVGHARQVATQ